MEPTEKQNFPAFSILSEILPKQGNPNHIEQLINSSARALTQSDLRQYIDGDEQVVAMQTIINEIALVRNKFISISKGFETENWQISNLTKLYAAGLDGIVV